MAHITIDDVTLLTDKYITSHIRYAAQARVLAALFKQHAENPQPTGALWRFWYWLKGEDINKCIFYPGKEYIVHLPDVNHPTETKIAYVILGQTLSLSFTNQ